MLTTKLQGQVRGEYERVIDLLGVQATWTQAKAPHRTLTGITVGFKTAGWDDTKVVNSYGIGAKIITFKQKDFGTAVPDKFDELDIMGEIYTLDAVFPVHLNNQLIGFKGYVRGN